MCEKRMYSKTLDGLCNNCHIELCFKPAEECYRCRKCTQNLIDWNLIDWIKGIDDEEEEKEEEN